MSYLFQLSEELKSKTQKCGEIYVNKVVSGADRGVLPPSTVLVNNLLKEFKSSQGRS